MEKCLLWGEYHQQGQLTYYYFSFCFSFSQICISFALHRGLGVIPGTVIPEQIVENMKATEIVLDNNDMTRLSTINKDLRFIDVCKSMIILVRL